MHACALRSTGELYCWGAGSENQLLPGTTTMQTAPVLVDVGATVQSVALGHQHSCALTTAGEVLCWGDNARGQLGDGTTDERTGVVHVREPEP